MKIPFFRVSLNHSKHYGQLYEGFNRLQKKGLLRYIIDPAFNPHPKLLGAKLNNQFTILFDELDGLNWIEANRTENLKYFKSQIKADYYFKRSFTEELESFAPDNCKIYPLGFNYGIIPGVGFSHSLKQHLRNLAGNNSILRKLTRVNRQFTTEDLEYYPFYNEPSRILLLTRLWDPNEVSGAHIKSEREALNLFRIESIRSCKERYGSLFIGGLQDDPLSQSMAPDLIVSESITARENFIRLVRDVNICIATTGLHGSTGWRLGEFIASSRAIVSEKLNYKVPGNFIKGVNYREFQDLSSLHSELDYLLGNKTATIEMMYSNNQYYNNFLRPDMILLNAFRNIQDVLYN